MDKLSQRACPLLFEKVFGRNHIYAGIAGKSPLHFPEIKKEPDPSKESSSFGKPKGESVPFRKYRKTRSERKFEDTDSVLGMNQIQIAGGERSLFQVLQLQSRTAPRTIAAEQDVFRTFL